MRLCTTEMTTSVIIKMMSKKRNQRKKKSTNKINWHNDKLFINHLHYTSQTKEREPLEITRESKTISTCRGYFCPCIAGEGFLSAFHEWPAWTCYYRCLQWAVFTKYLCKWTACSSTQTDLAVVQVSRESNVANQPRVVHQISQKPGPDITMLRKQHSDESAGYRCTMLHAQEHGNHSLENSCFSFTGRNYHKYVHTENEIAYLDKLQNM